MPKETNKPQGLEQVLTAEALAKWASLQDWLVRHGKELDSPDHEAQVVDAGQRVEE